MRLFHRTAPHAIPLFMVLLLAGSFAGIAPVSAGSFNPDCTAVALEGALQTANTNNQPDTITLAAGCTYIVAPGRLSVAADNGNLLTLEGNWASILDDNSSEFEAVFKIAVNANVHIRQIWISGGNRGIENEGVLAVDDSTFIQNGSLLASGGAISNTGVLTVQRSTFTNNTSLEGASVYNTGIVSLANTTITSNTGSAIYNESGGLMTIKNSTVAANDNLISGGIINAGLLNIHNSIVADNTQSDCVNTASGTLTVSHSLVRDASCGVVDGVNSNSTGVDPALGTLTGNPAYFPLHEGSPAINTGSNSLISLLDTTDQASRPRIISGTVDMGAYEYSPPTNLTVQLNMQRGANPPTDTWITTVHVEIRPTGSTTPYQAADYMSDSFGRIYLTDLFRGSYDLWIKGTHTLARILPVTLVQENDFTGMSLLLEGDADDSNTVTLTDFSLLAASFGTATGQVGYDVRADFNQDGTIGLSDFSLLASNFDQAGAP